MLNKGNMKILGIALCYAQDETNSRYLSEITKTAEENGYKVLIFGAFNDFKLDDSPDNPIKCIFRIINYDILDGLIILTESIQSHSVVDRIYNRARAAKIPVVSIMSPLDGACNISFDYVENFRAIIGHVIEKHNCKRNFFISGIEGNSFSEERTQCFREVMAEHGLEVNDKWIGYGSFWEGPTYELLDKWLADPEFDKPDAIICANDSMALAVCIKLVENGYRVPEDIIVTGHDGILAEKYHSPRLTTAAADIEAAARAAVLAIIDYYEKGIPLNPSLVINSKLVISESCGCKKIRNSILNKRIADVFNSLSTYTYFEDQLNGMAASLTEQSNFDEFRKALINHIASAWAHSLWFCMSSDACKPRQLNADELSDESTISQPKTKFFEGDRLLNVIAWEQGKEYKPCDIEFDRNDLLPNLIQKLEMNNTIFFTPIFFRNLPQGYIAFCTDIDNTRIKFMSMFINYINMILEVVIQKSFINSAISQLKSMYIQDFMTGLYNRRGFYSRIRPRLERCISMMHEIVIISVDMDGLKKINDTYGHKEGDAAIKQLSKLLKQSADNNAIIARFGGDEFVAAAISEDGQKYAENFRAVLTRKIEAYNEISDKPYKINASIGISVTKPEDIENIDHLIDIADAIMYSEKEKHHKHTRG